MKTESQVTLLLDEMQADADIQALKIIISGLVAQIVNSQGHPSLDIAELHALRRMNNADTASGAEPNPILIARFFANARRKSGQSAR